MALPNQFQSALLRVLGGGDDAIGLGELDDVEVKKAPLRSGRRHVGDSNGQGGAPGTVDLGTSGGYAPAPQEVPFDSRAPGGGTYDAPPSLPEVRKEQAATDFREGQHQQERSQVEQAQAAEQERRRVAGLPPTDQPNIALPPLEPWGNTANIRPDAAGLAADKVSLGGQVSTGRNQFVPFVHAAREEEMGAAMRGSAMQSQALQSQAALSDSQARAMVPAVMDQRRMYEDAKQYASFKRGAMEQASKLYADAVSTGIRPDRIFDDGRVNKMQALVAAGASGMVNFFYQTGEPNNRAIDLLDKMIDRDIAAQEADIQNRGQYADNMLAQLQLALGDKDEARDVFRSMYLELMGKETEAALARTADATQRSNLEGFLAAQQRIAQEYNATKEEEYLGRKLKGDTENLRQRSALEQKRMETLAAASNKLGEAQKTEIAKATEKYGLLVDLQRKREHFLNRVNEAYKRFGKIPGLGIIEGSGAGRFVITKWDDLVNGPHAPTTPDEQQMAAEIVQLGKELDQGTAVANRTPGAQSDWEAMTLINAFGVAGKGERSALEMTERARRTTRNYLVRNTKGDFSTDEARDYWFGQFAPEMRREDPDVGVKQTKY